MQVKLESAKTTKTRDMLPRAMRLANRVMPKLSSADKVLLMSVPLTEEWRDEDIDMDVWNNLTSLFMEFHHHALVDYDQMFCEYPIDSFVSSLMAFAAFSSNFETRRVR